MSSTSTTTKTPIHVFSSEIFPRNLYIVKQPPKGWLRKHFKTMAGEELREHSIEEGKAVTYQDVEHTDTHHLGILIVLLDDEMTLSDCAHEATHYALGIYAAIGEEPSVTQQEVLAYLVGYATDCIYQVVKDDYRPMFNGSQEI